MEETSLDLRHYSLVKKISNNKISISNLKYHFRMDSKYDWSLNKGTTTIRLFKISHVNIN